MFGLKNKTAAKINMLEDRLASLARKVEDNNHDIGELKGTIKELAQVKPEVVTRLTGRVVLLEERQSQLRDRVGQLFVVPKELGDD